MTSFDFSPLTVIYPSGNLSRLIEGPYFTGMTLLLSDNSTVDIEPTNQTIQRLIDNSVSFSFNQTTIGIFKVVRYPLYGTVNPTRGFYGSDIQIDANKFGANKDSIVFRLDSRWETYATFDITYPKIKNIELVPTPFISPRDAFNLRQYDSSTPIGNISIKASYGCFEPCLKTISNLSQLDSFKVIRTRIPLRYDGLIAIVNGSTFVSYAQLPAPEYSAHFEFAIGILVTYIALFVLIIYYEIRYEKRPSANRRSKKA